MLTLIKGKTCIKHFIICLCGLCGLAIAPLDYGKNLGFLVFFD